MNKILAEAITTTKEETTTTEKDTTTTEKETTTTEKDITFTIWDTFAEGKPRLKMILIL